MIDIHPAAQRTVDVITSLDDDELGLVTPCPEAEVGDLVDHLGVFAVVSVADGAAPLDRLLGLTGRDPSWQPPGREVASS
jgi:hypothetical protein